MKLLQIIKYDELIDSLSINRKRPSIKATDILIETKAAGLSPSDYKMVYTIFYKLFFEIQSTEMLCFPENLHDCYFGWL
jgi:NADPH:quinone reductase-like Zn-dependent oxidoreductase